MLFLQQVLERMEVDSGRERILLSISDFLTRQEHAVWVVSDNLKNLVQTSKMPHFMFFAIVRLSGVFKGWGKNSFQINWRGTLWHNECCVGGVWHGICVLVCQVVRRWKCQPPRVCWAMTNLDATLTNLHTTITNLDTVLRHVCTVYTNLIIWCYRY